MLSGCHDADVATARRRGGEGDDRRASPETKKWVAGDDHIEIEIDEVLDIEEAMVQGEEALPEGSADDTPRAVTAANTTILTADNDHSRHHHATTEGTEARNESGSASKIAGAAIGASDNLMIKNEATIKTPDPDRQPALAQKDHLAAGSPAPGGPVTRPSRSTQGTVFRSPVEHAYTSSDVAVWVPRSADSRTCVVTVVRIVLARPRIVLARPYGYRNAISACASAQHAKRSPRERRNTQNARRTHDTRRNRATRNTRELRSTKFEFRVQVRVGARRNPPRGPTLVAGWLAGQVLWARWRRSGAFVECASACTSVWLLTQS